MLKNLSKNMEDTSKTLKEAVDNIPEELEEFLSLDGEQNND